MVIRPKSALRHEIKFLVNCSQHIALLEALKEHLQPDLHSDVEGHYLVSSLYYDTPDYKAYWDKVDGFNFRRKVRARLYGDQLVEPESSAFLEIKARMGTRMGKRRLQLPYVDAVNFAEFEAGLATLSSEEQATAQELYYLFGALQLQPTCVVSYQRAAFGGHTDHPDLRITFDTDVRGRVENLSLLARDSATGPATGPATGNGGMTTLLDPGWAIMEIKVNQTIPFWLGELLSQQGCTPRRISKYCATLERCRAIRRRQHILQSG